MASDRIDTGCHTLAGTAEESFPELPQGIAGDVDIVVKADKANAADIRIGPAGLTADTTAATAGYPLAPGEPIKIPLRNVSSLRLRGASGDKMYFIALYS